MCQALCATCANDRTIKAGGAFLESKASALTDPGTAPGYRLRAWTVRFTIDYRKPHPNGHPMQTVDLKITLSDQVAREAQEAGLLTERGIKRLIEDAIRREAGTKLLDAMRRLRDARLPPLTEDEIVAEVAAVRAWRRRA